VLGSGQYPSRREACVGGSHLREVLGFVCRWSLLALAGAGCMAIGWVSALVVDVAAGEVGAAFTVPDAIYPQQGDPRRLVWGYLHPHLRYPAPIMAACHSQDGPLLLVDGDSKTLYPVVEAADSGVYRVIVTGMPHSPVAFRQETAILWVVPQRRKVFLIDAATYLDASAARQAEYRGRLAEMRRRGEVALFEAGSRDEFLAHRARLRRLHPSMPLLWTPREVGDELATLNRAARPVKAQSVVVTDRPALAARAASAGFATELIASAGQ